MNINTIINHRYPLTEEEVIGKKDTNPINMPEDKSWIKYVCIRVGIDPKYSIVVWTELVNLFKG
jgi:hypothetical protein